MSLSHRGRRVPLLLAASALAALGTAGLAQNLASFSAQAEAGKLAYAKNCAACHGAEMQGQIATGLKGDEFLGKWGAGSATLDDLSVYIRENMPPGQGGILPDETYTNIIAYIMEQNGAKHDGPLSAGENLSEVTLPAPTVDSAVGGLSTRVHPLPPGPPIPNPLASYTPVTEALLSDPPADEWPAWRRSHLGHGYSPLGQIDTSNVGKLTVAWAQALPAGNNMNEPLVHNGVLYVFGYGDQVFAFDAASGRMLWRYQRKLAEGTPLTSHKTIALYGDNLYTATSDNKMIALNAQTGKLVWETSLTDRDGMRNPGGPLAADGVIMQGMASQAPGGGIITAFDAATGKRLWTFETVAKDGQPGGDTWNGEPSNERKGGSVWTSGSYDPVNKLALWGVGNTYDTAPLRDLKPGMNNDALYTESTLAFDPHTGKLVWYYQHNRNDQYDLDWVFDRVIGTLEVGGKTERVVLTGGKSGLFDALDAKTGKYLKTFDMGIQDYIDRIDPVTGDKHVKPELTPGRDKGPVFMCPHGGGGRNWSPTSWNPETKTFFVNARDVCTDLTPTSGAGLLSTGVRAVYAPPPNGDGNYGVLQAIDPQSGKVLWETRRRQTPDMGILTTAGGLLFTGWMDRQFVAYDQKTGKQLWSTGVTGVPNASAITYSIDGKQYVAMVTGVGNPLSFGIPDVIPETQLPPVTSSAVYVFALPDDE
ncbi:PQQ-binding-like beta-propeller repeat protein [Altererythrobacter salegens]|uniref:PQQ-binding-like beta-propeller repeat protein n=1 Tax=Croceibacterium salegens TaxID=1737568 RepID=A0A6I4SVX0_9SPHN|nr:PQQ-binding-like beta-propeller repeat protein [Croceibacterium salegens]MXO58916.1 PQQ-binding-like beta-propeller repeat protein [Croceibacterium salegens]